MKALAFSAVLLFVAACGMRPHASEFQREPIFREVMVGFQQKITLGEKIRADVRPLLIEETPERYRLRPGTFGGAESIAVHVDAEEVVHELRFRYGAETNFYDQVASYRSTLGDPQLEEIADGEGVVRWEDDMTTFELVNRGGQIESRLRDRTRRDA